MKLLQEPEDATRNKKLMKSQVEKRRRERMNRSLERLRTMLMEEKQPQGGGHRVEKAEILEHTVLFLQKSAPGHQTADHGSQKHPFEDGFTACLQRAAQFLGPQGKGLWLGPALDATLVRFGSDPAHFQKMKAASSSLPRARSLLRMLRLKSRHKPQGQGPVRTNPPTNQQQKSVSPTQNQTVGQSLWRPWPCSV
uniref:Hairy and enhancer of split related-7 n=1 Tax=Sphaeramia orbicularis TaxID=375764 RepID=A0A673B521_9TELE